MIINYLYIVGIAFAKLKADAPLIINTNAVLALSLSDQFFKVI